MAAWRPGGGQLANDGGAGGGATLSARRLEGFSDGAMAVIITIVAHRLRAPSATLSFTIVATIRNKHHRRLRTTLAISGGVMGVDLLRLFGLALIPVLFAWIAQAPGETLPAACYGMAAAVADTCDAILGRVIIRADSRSSQVAGASRNCHSLIRNRSTPEVLLLSRPSVDGPGCRTCRCSGTLTPMPTTRPRHVITESDAVTRALDDAARRWPSDNGSRTKLLVHLVEEGHRALIAERERSVEARRRTVEATSGALTGLYGRGYLDALREDWPT
ncbi:MAG: TMEM175 family protein [Candidatus Dormibacteria bacterium]